MDTLSARATSSTSCAPSRARPSWHYIIESCIWGNLAHRLMQEKIALGRNEMDISFEASTEAAG